MDKLKENSQKYKITYGGWYQRTTIHLSEIYDLLKLGRSKLDLSKEKLQDFHRQLDLKNVERKAGQLEYIYAQTNSGIEIRYYEDGLYVLELKSSDIKKSQKLLKDYYDKVFQPAIDYIFSKGAPTPKILANIKKTHPIVIGLSLKEPEAFKVNEKVYGEVYSKISSKDITVYKTPNYIFIVSGLDSKTSMSKIIEMQIFFREFKDQLERYLDIHRVVWEEISIIKDKEYIRGMDVTLIRSRLDCYQTTINLIRNRINQMGAYVHTRASLAKDLAITEQLVTLFEYKFEVLQNTMGYIKEIWKMTNDYIVSAISIIVEIENLTTNVSINSLRLVTAIGVASGILGYLARDQLPKVSASGMVYFVILIAFTLLINFVISKIYQRRKYRLSIPERVEDI